MLSLRANFRLFLVALWFAALTPFQAMAHMLRIPLRFHIPVLINRVLIKNILGIKLICQGNISTHTPTLFVSNHLSYLDILAIGGSMPCTFVSKSEVADWPIFGFLAKIQDTIFVKRSARSQSLTQNDEMAEALAQGQNLVVFPEGTSTDGRSVYPFKPTLLQSAFTTPDTVDVYVQAIAISCTHPDGKAFLYPWYDEMTLVEHLQKILKIDDLTVTLTFLPPVRAKEFENRKALAKFVHQQVVTAPFGLITKA